MIQRAAILVILATFSLATLDPYQKGPLEVKHQNYYRVLTSGLDHNLKVWAPNEPGNFPVVYFNSGLAGFYTIL